MKMKKMFFCMATIIPLFFTVFANDLISEKLRLNGKLDSLDLERQACKRLGKSVSYLDKEYSMVYDTLSKLREEVSKSVEADVIGGDENIESPKVSKRNLLGIELNKIIKPLVIGIIVLVVLILLLVFIMGIFKTKVKDRKTQKELLSQKFSGYGVNQKTVESDKQIKSQSLSDTDISIAAIRKNVRGEGDIDALRKLNNVSGSTASPFMNMNNELVNDVENYAQQDFTEDTENSSDDIKLRIVKDFERGVSVNDISKKYKLSYDQVNLIIKLSKER